MMNARIFQMPAALRECARWERIGPSGVPGLLIHPEWDSSLLVPVVVWLHGRTANKELDPGRYLRWLRAGIGTCAVDLPGHGERFDKALQSGTMTPAMLMQMVEEIDGIVQSLASQGRFDMTRIGIGGMSAGGMAALARLCRSHAFRCASVEATTGAWRLHFADAVHHQFSSILDALDPIDHLDGWREIPLQVIHATGDQMVSHSSQVRFVEALRQRYRDPAHLEWIEFTDTGAPGEHIGFGRFSAEAKDRQRVFLTKWLIDQP